MTGKRKEQAPFSAEDCLSCDPFLGDMDGGPVLSDKVVKFRAHGATCNYCREAIPAGSWGRSRTEKTDGELMSFRWCTTCSKAMAEDDDDTIEARIQMGVEQ